jgi:hypothetical protein
MTPNSIVEALRLREFDAIRADGTDEFQKQISTDEMDRVWTDMERSIGPLHSVGPEIVLHDVALHCEKGEAHLQVAYRNGVLAGLVLAKGPPTGRFGR